MSTSKRQSRIERLLQSIGLSKQKIEPVKKSTRTIRVLEHTGFIIDELPGILDEVYGQLLIEQLNLEEIFEHKESSTQKVYYKLKGSIHPGLPEYYPIRLGFIMRFSEDDKKKIELSQLVAFVTQVPGVSIGNTPTIHETALKIMKVPLASAFGENGNVFSATWYRFGPTDFAGLKSFSGISEGENDLIEMLQEKDGLENTQADHIIHAFPKEEYTVLLTDDLNAEPHKNLQFFKTEIDHVLFSEANFSLLHGRLTKLKAENTTSGNILNRVFFSGASINMGRVASGYSQLELVAVGVGTYPEEADFTLKAEVIQYDDEELKNLGLIGISIPRDMVVSAPVSIGKETPASYSARFGVDTESGDDPIPPIVFTVGTDVDTALPLVITSLPCPKIWEIDGDGGP